MSDHDQARAGTAVLSAPDLDLATLLAGLDVPLPDPGFVGRLRAALTGHLDLGHRLEAAGG